MPTFVTLHNFTDQAVRDINNVAQHDAAIEARLAELGIEVTAHYVVMGEYDEVVIWTAPSDEVALIWLLELGAMGERRSVTLRAFSDEQFMGALESRP